MKQLFAYIRVSTPKQGKGVSLQEQRSAIQAYAARTGAEISQWFEEKRTAAKAGRPEFARLVGLLRRNKADGVVIHKVDRSSRNFRDWADIDELIDSGLHVHFANEDLDLHSRGGRLAADIQMVVAVDYIRNLREEALKGIHGRLKQGILPHHAPIGYLDCGAGKPKAIDPVRGPIIRELFERYAEGSVTLRELTSEAATLGLTNSNGNPLRLTQIHAMMRNPFYSGVIRSARYGLFKGAHDPIAKPATFEQVQAVLDGKFVRRTRHHVFLFRRLLHCSTCGRCLIGSERKGRVYYRCSNIPCPTTSVREDRIEASIRLLLDALTLSDEEAALIERQLAERSENDDELVKARRRTAVEQMTITKARLVRLADLLIDGKIEPALHDQRRGELILKQHALDEELRALEESGARPMLAVAKQIVELTKHPATLYERAVYEQKRRMLGIVLSNCIVNGKTLDFALREPFATIAARNTEQVCRPHWDTARTLAQHTAHLTSELIMLLLSASWPNELVKMLADFLSKAVRPNDVKRI
jgi:DNA invertase Pin-like site-specific DNA recombinase